MSNGEQTGTIPGKLKKKGVITFCLKNGIDSHCRLVSSSLRYAAGGIFLESWRSVSITSVSMTDLMLKSGLCGDHIIFCRTPSNP